MEFPRFTPLLSDFEEDRLSIGDLTPPAVIHIQAAVQAAGKLCAVAATHTMHSDRKRESVDALRTIVVAMARVSRELNISLEHSVRARIRELKMEFPERGLSPQSSGRRSPTLLEKHVQLDELKLDGTFSGVTPSGQRVTVSGGSAAPGGSGSSVSLPQPVTCSIDGLDNNTFALAAASSAPEDRRNTASAHSTGSSGGGAVTRGSNASSGRAGVAAAGSVDSSVDSTPTSSSAAIARPNPLRMPISTGTVNLQLLHGSDSSDALPAPDVLQARRPTAPFVDASQAERMLPQFAPFVRGNAHTLAVATDAAPSSSHLQSSDTTGTTLTTTATSGLLTKDGTPRARSGTSTLSSHHQTPSSGDAVGTNSASGTGSSVLIVAAPEVHPKVTNQVRSARVDGSSTDPLTPSLVPIGASTHSSQSHNSTHLVTGTQQSNLPVQRRGADSAKASVVVSESSTRNNSMTLQTGLAALNAISHSRSPGEALVPAVVEWQQQSVSPSSLGTDTLNNTLTAMSLSPNRSTVNAPQAAIQRTQTATTTAAQLRAGVSRAVPMSAAETIPVQGQPTFSAPATPVRQGSSVSTIGVGGGMNAPSGSTEAWPARPQRACFGLLLLREVARELKASRAAASVAQGSGTVWGATAKAHTRVPSRAPSAGNMARKTPPISSPVMHRRSSGGGPLFPDHPSSSNSVALSPMGSQSWEPAAQR